MPETHTLTDDLMDGSNIDNLDKVIRKHPRRHEMIKPSEKTNGFARPLSYHQMISWVIFCFNAVSNMGIIYQFDQEGQIMNEGLIHPAILALAILLLAVLVLGYKTTKSDPSDRTVRLERYCFIEKVAFDEDQYEFYCHLCTTHV
jgi:hypothetical protein